MRQEVSQAREADSSVQYTGTPRARFGFTVGAKLGTYDGSACLETFIARFNNCARYFKWDEEDKLFQLCASLSGPAGQILWDTGTQTTADEVMRLLRNRFASINQAERFCAELRARKRKPGESLQKLYQDICRLMFLAYPGPTSELSNNVARDAFLEALDNSSLRVRILKKEPVNLDDALKLACRLEAFDKSASQEATNASTDARRDKKFLKAASGGNYQQTSAGDRQWLDDMKQLQDSLHECCSQVTQCRQELEAMKQSQIQPPVPPVAVGWTPVGSAFQSPLSMSYDASGASQVPQHPVEQAGGKTGTACHRCGQEGHWARSCPLGRDQKSGRWGKTSQPSGEQADKPKIQPLSYIKGKADVYLPVNLFGRKALVLLDTGCDTSVIGRNLLPTDVEIRTLFAANKMEITLLNEVHTVFSVAGQEYFADVVVTEAIKKLILGIDWLASKACRWDFEHARLGLGDRWVCLQSRPRRSQVRRIYAEESMAVPAWSQVDLPVRVTWPSLRPAENSLMVEPTTVKENVITAQTLLDKDTFRSAVRVINLSDDSCKIKEGLCLAQCCPTRGPHAAREGILCGLPSSHTNCSFGLVISQMKSTCKIQQCLMVFCVSKFQKNERICGFH